MPHELLGYNDQLGNPLTAAAAGQSHTGNPT
jgi:hypothetical protein